MELFEPDRYFSSLTSIHLDHDLLDKGLTHVLLDVDNTVRSRATHDVPAPVMAWLARAQDAGVAFCLLSNNWHDDIFALAEDLGMPIQAKALKPLPFSYGRAMKRIDGVKEDTVTIGDQLMTDVVGAHLAGLAAWLVQPLSEVDIRSTTMIRSFERMMIGARQPEGVSVRAERGE